MRSNKVLWEMLPHRLRRGLGRLLCAVPQRALLGARFRACERSLRDSEHWSRDRNEAYVCERLREICELARKRSPFYRNWFTQAGFEPRDMTHSTELARLPTIDKRTLKEHLHEMMTVPPGAAGAEYTTTGGTGGNPLCFYINANRSSTEYAYLLSSWGRVGYKLGMPLAVFRGRIVGPNRDGLRHEYDPLLRHHYYSNFHMTDASMARYLRHLGTIGPCHLHVYPSSVTALARFARTTGAVVPSNVLGIIAESEIVYPEQRKLAEEVFGCRLFSSYGHTEKLIAAAECEYSTNYHVWPTYGYFELLDESGKPVKTPGQSGEIVGTGFINTVTPFIRYRTGDFATFVGEGCSACGRAHALIRDIVGHRTQEFLIAADGSEISWTAMNMHDNTFENVRQFQFAQNTAGRAVLRLVPAEGFGERDVERIRRRLDEKFAGRISWETQRVDSIPLSPRGKAIYVEQSCPPAQA